jgi:hypothetical protein
MSAAPTPPYTANFLSFSFVPTHHSLTSLAIGDGGWPIVRTRPMSLLEVLLCTAGCVIFLIVGTITIDALKRPGRDSKLRKLLNTLGFRSLGGGFPETFPKSRTWAADAAKFPIVAGGRRGPHDMLLFDYLQKNGLVWTMIAVRSFEGRFPQLYGTSEFAKQVVDDWTLYRPGRQLTVQEVQAIVESIPE